MLARLPSTSILASLTSLALLLGCPDSGTDIKEPTEDSGGTSDADADGYTADAGDCDDHEDSVFPGAVELCNQVDDNCDGAVDEGVTSRFYADADGDGYGSTTDYVEACSPPAGFVERGTDCDDADSSVYPSAEDLCDSVDNDCDGDTDEDGLTRFYLDTDGDGFGDHAAPTEACEPSDGVVADDTDCDDDEAATYPGAAELCDGADNDCDGVADEETGIDLPWYQDRDEDGYGDPDRVVSACAAPVGYVADGSDCDDLVPETWPGADEVCDGADNDCDGEVDESAVDATAWYTDADADTFGDVSVVSWACSAPAGSVASASDCDDADATVNPAAAEVCDGADNNCDGSTDESTAADAATWYADSDSDGYGDLATSGASCSQPAGWLADASDCDDSLATVSPGAPELCDGIDDDCDGDIDEDSATDAPTWYQDRDGDGYGDATRSDVACSAPADYVADATDCDDLAVETWPGADETCDGDDNDCDGTVDEDAVDALVWYTDADSDGFGDVSVVSLSCSAVAGTVADATDCDDSDAGVSPDALELCNGVDDNCDGAVDEATALDAGTWYADADSDGFGDVATSVVECSTPTGWLADGSDCDDTDSAVSPAALELCNTVDDDCDGAVDESTAIDASTWYADRDADGYGDATLSQASCTQPTAYVADDTDCDDLEAGSYPGALEVCDGADNDCNGTADDSAIDASTWYADADGDGYGDATLSTDACDAPTDTVADATDCDDGDAASHPGGTEVCDGADNDCDTTIDEPGAFGETSWYADADADGYGDEADAPSLACDAPAGTVADNTDCDDAEADVNPGETEYCDGTDNDCDGSEDGTVTFTDTSGAVSDVSTAWGAGTRASPAEISNLDSGTFDLCDGTYYVEFTTSAVDITLEGLNGSAYVELNAGGVGRTVYATGGVTLVGLTLTDGYAVGTGGSLFVSGGDAVLDDVIVSDGAASKGANIGCSSCTLDLTDVTIENGTGTNGGGLYVTAGTVTGDTVVVSGNSAASGGGMYFATSSTGTFTALDLSSNTATTNGGGLYQSGGTVTVTRSSITSNSGADYGAGLYLSAGTFRMTTSNINSNDASVLGGGAYLTGAANLYCTGSSTSNAGIWGNTALVAGGAYLATTTASLSSTTCDWTASSDNTLYDIVTSLLNIYTKGNNASFTCSSGSCT